MTYSTQTATKGKRGTFRETPFSAQEIVELRPLPATDPLLLREIGDVFILEESLHQGGQAQVVYAREAYGDEVPFALKFYGNNRDAAVREWSILQIHRNDPAVPLCYGIGHVKRGGETNYCVIMERIEGKTLRSLLGEEEFRSSMTLEKALGIIRPIVRFCAKYSRVKSVHRDIKPANIMVSPDRTAIRLIDFGIGGHGTSVKPDLGSCGYAAPEMWFQDEGADQMSGMIDTYGIGATLYSLLYDGNAPEYELEGRIETKAFRHEEDLTSTLNLQVAEALREKVSEREEKLRELAQNAVRASLHRMDTKIVLRLRECLAPKQEDRPHPESLESILPLDSEQYKNELFSHAMIHALAERSGERNAGAFRLPNFKAEASADQDFIVALNEFNSGRYENALPILRKRAEAGNLSAMYYLGVCIRDGLGTLLPEEGPAAVAYYFSRAAEAGNLLAQNAYGLLLIEGEGVDRNEEKGRRWIEQSAADDPSTGKTGFLVAKKWLASHETR